MSPKNGHGRAPDRLRRQQRCCVPVKEALAIALGSRCNSRAVFRYMAGVAYNWLREGDQRTSDILKES